METRALKRKSPLVRWLRRQWPDFGPKIAETLASSLLPNLSWITRSDQGIILSNFMDSFVRKKIKFKEKFKIDFLHNGFSLN